MQRRSKQENWNEIDEGRMNVKTNKRKSERKSKMSKKRKKGKAIKRKNERKKKRTGMAVNRNREREKEVDERNEACM